VWGMTKEEPRPVIPAEKKRKEKKRITASEREKGGKRFFRRSAQGGGGVVSFRSVMRKGGSVATIIWQKKKGGGGPPELLRNSLPTKGRKRAPSPDRGGKKKRGVVPPVNQDRAFPRGRGRKKKAVKRILGWPGRGRNLGGIGLEKPVYKRMLTSTPSGTGKGNGSAGLPKKGKKNTQVFEPKKEKKNPILPRKKENPLKAVKVTDTSKRERKRRENRSLHRRKRQKKK